MGDIDDDQYMAREADLMRQLREVREWREEFGMSTSGGPVRVAQSDEAGEPGDVRAADPRSANVRLTFDDTND
jgi:hypothetical protein